MAFSNLAWEVTLHHFSHTGSSGSHKTSQVQGEGTQTLPLNSRSVKELVGIFFLFLSFEVLQMFPLAPPLTVDIFKPPHIP